MWEILLVPVLIFLSLILYVKKQYCYWKDRGVPYCEPEFPYGTVSTGKNRPHSTQQNLLLYRQYKNETPFVGLFFSIRPAALAVNLGFIKKVLINDFQYFHDRGTFYNEQKDPLSAHLFNLEGAKWKKLRGKLTPTFTSGKMKFMFSTLASVGDQLVQLLNDELKMSSEIEMKEILARFTTDVIGNCAFGLDCNSLMDPDAKFRDMGRKSFNAPRNSRAKTMLLLSFRGLAKFFNQKTVRDDVSEFFLNIVRDTVEYRENNNVQRNDFMDLLIKLKNSENVDERLTLNEIAAQAFVFFLAGFETSSTTMSYALYELALNEEIQAKARKNIQNALDNHSGKFTYESVNEMTYIDYCVNESMRKYPPGSNLIRVASKDYEYDGKVLEKGTTLLIPVYAIHHDEDYYPEPNKYIPERFEPANVAKRPPITYMPFGEGPRVCVGLRFGLMQARIGLAILLHNFKFTLSKRTPVPLTFSKTTLVLTAEGGLYFNLEKIQ